MDIDHSGRNLAQKFYKIRDPDYYEFEGNYTYIPVFYGFKTCYFKT